jgi:oxygen tolerance protein BatD
VKSKIWYFATFVALASVWISAAAQASEVRAWLDRNNMQMGETVTLNVEVSGDVGASQPDFGALRQDFDLLGTQSSSSMNIINGQTTSKRLWAVGLEPKHAGALVIPALDIAGQHTQALTLTVAQGAAGGSRTGDDVFIEVTAEPRAPYVQQEVRFTVKLYFALNLSDGSLDDPQADGLLARKLGQDANYSADVGGKRYRVLERHYSLVAEKSGSLALPVIAFRGHAIDPGDINSFFSRGHVIGARSEAITLDVRPRPATSGTDAWLPARSVSLTADGIDTTTVARVGEPLTFTLHLKAQGLGFEQLPELKLPKIDGADVYPDKANTQNRDDGEWLYGERERKFAIVPNRAGALTLPAITLGWWDTAHDRAETAELPSTIVNVEAVTAIASAPPVTQPTKGSAGNNFPVPATAITASSLTADRDAETSMWRTLAFFALALWVATLLGWIVWLLAQRRRERVMSPTAPVDTTSASARSAFRQACKQNDWPAAARAVLTWARSTKSDIRNLGDLARSLGDSAQIAVIGELDRACYGSGIEAGLGDRLATAFRNGPVFSRSATSVSSSSLPPLYPSDR